jgi:hypothetical protein
MIYHGVDNGFSDKLPASAERRRRNPTSCPQGRGPISVNIGYRLPLKNVNING